MRKCTKTPACAVAALVDLIYLLDDIGSFVHCLPLGALVGASIVAGNLRLLINDTAHTSPRVPALDTARIGHRTQ